MKVIKFFTAILFLLIAGCGIDSKRTTNSGSNEIIFAKIRQAERFKSSDPDSFILKYHAVANECKKEGLDSLLINSYLKLMFGYLYLKKDSIEGEKYFDSVNIIGQKSQNIKLRYIVQYADGIYFVIKRRYDSAAHYLLESIKNQPQVIDSERLLRCYANLAEIYHAQKNYVHALSSYTPLYDYAQRIKDSTLLLSACQNMYLYSLSAGDTGRAYAYLKEAEHISLSIKDSSELLSIYYRYSHYYKIKSEPDSAIYYSLSAIELSKTLNTNENVDQHYLMLSIHYLEKEDLSNAKKYFSKVSTRYVDAEPRLDFKRMYYATQTEILRQSGDFKNAFASQTLVLKFEEKIDSSDKNDQLLQHEANIKKLSAEKIIAAKDNKIERQKILTIALSIVSVLVVILATFIFFHVKRKKDVAILEWANKQKETELQNEKNMALQQAKERERIAQEMHDDVGSTLSALSMAVSLVQKEEESPRLETISSYVQHLSVKMNEIIWDLNTLNDNTASLIAYLRRYSKNFLEQSGIGLEFDTTNAGTTVPINGYTRRQIYLFTKELLNNTVKYAGASTVCITLQVYPKQIMLQYKDDGRGFDFKDSEFEGNGLRGIIKRVDMFKGSFYLNAENGTTVLISLPL